MNCTAKKTNGQPCKAPAIQGGRVCRVHGGSAPQVRAAALARIQAMVAPALDAMRSALSSEQGSVAVAAARDILDRAGLKAGDSISVEAGANGSVQIVIRPVATTAE